MTPWILWGALLFAQTSSNTWVSRARNSPRIAMHALASVFSNGVFFGQLYCAVDQIHQARGFWGHVGVIAFYVVFTVAGGITTHWLLLRKKL